MTNARSKTTESGFQLCDDSHVDDDQQEPELATNDEWRGIMVRARKEHDLTQDELGNKFGVSQAMISKLETGEAGSSKLVLPICRLLGIPLPEHFVDEEDREWVRLGRVLRHRNREQAKLAVKLVESMVKQYDDAEDAQPTVTEPPKRKSPQG